MREFERSNLLDDHFYMTNWTVFRGLLESCEDLFIRSLLCTKFIVEFRRSLVYVLYSENGFDPDCLRLELEGIREQANLQLKAKEEAARISSAVCQAESTKKRRGL